MTTASPQTLFDIAGIRARIFTLPHRPPFMFAADLAEVYGTEYRRVTEAVKRNLDIFPEDFAFYLTPEEVEKLPDYSATSQGKRTDLRPLVFTHAGANGLSAIIKSATARQMHVAVHRAFAAMEAAALAEARDMVARVRVEAQRKKPIFGFIAMSMEKGLSIEAMRRMSSYPLWKLEQAARDMLAMRLIDRLPEGMTPGLFDAV